MKLSLCEKCGACCAMYPVPFAETETDKHLGSVPYNLTLGWKATERIMKGTQENIPRCIALEGVVASHVSCAIYEFRPSTCRIFFKSWETGRGNHLCDKARQIYGLQPFSKY